MFRTVLASSWQMSLEHACNLKILCYHALPVSSSHASNPPAPTAPGKNHHFTKGPKTSEQANGNTTDAAVPPSPFSDVLHRVRLEVEKGESLLHQMRREKW